MKGLIYMKKISLLLIIATLSACSELSSFMSSSESSASTNSGMRSCMFAEAQTRLQAGTLFNDTISATAKDIAGVCTKKLAFASVGISEENQKTAEAIINSLRGLNNS